MVLRKFVGGLIGVGRTSRRKTLACLVMPLAVVLGGQLVTTASAYGPYNDPAHCTSGVIKDYRPNTPSLFTYTVTSRRCQRVSGAGSEPHGAVTGTNTVYKFGRGDGVFFAGGYSEGWYLRNYGWIPCIYGIGYVSCGGI